MVEVTQELLNKLNVKPRDKSVVALRYGLIDGQKHSLQYVGEVFGLTRERIRQIEFKVINKIKNEI